MMYHDLEMTCSYNTANTYVALGLITVSAHSDGAPIHQRHDPLEMSLVDDAPIILKGLWIVCVKLLQSLKHNRDVQLVGH